MSNDNRIVTTEPDNFQWLTLNIDEAKDIFLNPNTKIAVYALDMHDFSECLVTDLSYFENYDTFGIEIGFKSALKIHEIAKLVTDSINGIYAAIQNKLGQKHGDNASMFHSGDGDKLEVKLVEHFIKYAAYEDECMRESDAHHPKQ